MRFGTQVRRPSSAYSPSLRQRRQPSNSRSHARQSAAIPEYVDRREEVGERNLARRQAAQASEFGCKWFAEGADDEDEAFGHAMFPPYMKGTLMKRQWIPLVAAAMFVGTMTVQAGDHVRPLPVGAPGAGGPIVLAPAPEAIPAPKQPAAGQGADTIIVIQDSCPDQPPQRPRKERFNLCDYWEILCACFYRG